MSFYRQFPHKIISFVLNWLLLCFFFFFLMSQLSCIDILRVFVDMSHCPRSRYFNFSLFTCFNSFSLISRIYIYIYIKDKNKHLKKEKKKKTAPLTDSHPVNIWFEYTAIFSLDDFRSIFFLFLFFELGTFGLCIQD